MQFWGTPHNQFERSPHYQRVVGAQPPIFPLGSREAKRIVVGYPWGSLFLGNTNPATSSVYDATKRYLTKTEITVNPTGTRTDVIDTDENNGVQYDVVRTETPGFNPAEPVGAETGFSGSNTLLSYTYEYGSYSLAYTNEVSFSAQSLKAQEKLDEIIATVDCWRKTAFTFKDYYDSANNTTIAWVLGSQYLSHGLTADSAFNSIYISPRTFDGTDYIVPWDGIFEIFGYDAEPEDELNYFFHKGWSSGGISQFLTETLNATTTEPGGDTTDITEYLFAGDDAICSKSYHVMPNGHGCSAYDYSTIAGGLRGDILFSYGAAGGTNRLTESACSGIQFVPGAYCFDYKGYYRNGSGSLTSWLTGEMDFGSMGSSKYIPTWTIPECCP